MAYCVLADVLEMFPGISSLDTDSDANGITDARVTSNLIPEADARINARLRPHYDTIPITDADDLPLLRAISKRIVAAEVHDIIYEAHADAETSAEDPVGSASRWRREAMEELKAIIKGTHQLDTARISPIELGVLDDYEAFTTAESEDEMVSSFKRADDW